MHYHARAPSHSAAGQAAFLRFIMSTADSCSQLRFLASTALFTTPRQPGLRLPCQRARDAHTNTAYNTEK